MPTAQQRLRDWYRSESLLWRSVAVLVKAGIELGLFAIVATGVTAFFFIYARLGVIFDGSQVAAAGVWSGAVYLLARQEWCFTTAETDS